MLCMLIQTHLKMSEKYKFHDPDGVYFVTLTINNWIDLFTKPCYSQILLDSLKYCQMNKGLIVYAWVIMTNHIHLIISRRDASLLSDIIRDFKTYTSKSLIKEIKTGNDSRKQWMLKMFEKRANELKRVSYYKLWQDGNHPILLDDNKK